MADLFAYTKGILAADPVSDVLDTGSAGVYDVTVRVSASSVLVGGADVDQPNRGFGLTPGDYHFVTTPGEMFFYVPTGNATSGVSVLAVPRVD